MVAANPHIEATLRRIVARLVADYQPQRIILFGSYAPGTPETPHEDSDLDLLIIKDTDEGLVDRGARVSMLLDEDRDDMPLDTLVLTPKELQARLDRGDSFLRDVMETGETLYAR